MRIAEIGSTLIRIDHRVDGRVVAEHLGFILRRSVGWDVDSIYVSNLPKLADTNDLVLDIIAAMPEALSMAKVSRQMIERYTDATNKVLREHRIAFKFVGSELIPFESDELLQEVVEPALRLLVDARFQASHDAYLKALKEVARGDAGTAITDASTALQQALVAVGAEGNALGPLMKSAKKRGLLGTHDQPLVDGLAKLIDWVSSDRSALGNAHDYSVAVLADAWLTVHVVGALIVRLADPDLRGRVGDLA